MNDPIPSDVRELFDSEQDMESLLAKLRASGYRKAESIRFLAVIRNTGLAEAKKVVHFSATWSDAKENDEKLWDSFEQAVKEVFGDNAQPTQQGSDGA